MENELFKSIDSAIKNVAQKSDLLLYSKIDKKSKLSDDCIFLSMVYWSCFKKMPNIILDNLKNKKVSSRKDCGSFYTPVYIAEYICRNTIEIMIREKINNGKNETYKYFKKIDEIYDLKICDPAVGGGIFLICAHDLLIEILNDLGEPPEISARKAVKCLFGVDINKDAIEITKLLLNLNIIKWEMKKTKEFADIAE